MKEWNGTLLAAGKGKRRFRWIGEDNEGARIKGVEGLVFRMVVN